MSNETILRGKVIATGLGPRTMLRVTGLDGQTVSVVELLLPPGYSARPFNGADVLLLQVAGTSDHVVALGGDCARVIITDLAPGEFGLTDGTQTVVFRGGFLELVSPTKIRCVTPRLEVTGQIVAQCDGAASVTLDTHTHVAAGTGGHTAAPDPGT